MGKIKELDKEFSETELLITINELAQAINNLRCQEKEEPIYEVLNPYDCLLISKNEDGILVACSNEKGKVHLERVPYPNEDGKHRKAG